MPVGGSDEAEQRAYEWIQGWADRDDEEDAREEERREEEERRKEGGARDG